MECPECHALNPPGSKFCFQCGRALPTAQPTAPRAAGPQHARPEASSAGDVRRQWPQVTPVDTPPPQEVTQPILPIERIAAEPHTVPDSAGPGQPHLEAWGESPQLPSGGRPQPVPEQRTQTTPAGVPHQGPLYGPTAPAVPGKTPPPAQPVWRAEFPPPAAHRARRVPGIIFFLAGVAFVAIAGLVLWLLDLARIGPPPTPVEVTRIAELHPQSTPERRPGRETGSPVVEPVIIPTAAPTSAPVIPELPAPTPVPGPALSTPAEVPPTGSDYVERARSGEFASTTVTVLTVLSGDDAVRLEASLAGFQQVSGIDIELEVTNQALLPALKARIAAGDAPDMAIVPSALVPGLRELAAAGAVVDIGSFIDREALLDSYYPTWLDAATLEGPDRFILAGLWSRAQPRGLVFYALDDFLTNGYTAPGTWAELKVLSDRMVADGHVPWCVGMESGAQTGWVAHQWLEEILLRNSQLADYDLWAEGSLPFDSLQVRSAAQALADIWYSSGYVLGGREAIPVTSPADAVQPMFDQPPGCMMSLMGPWITDSFPPGAAFGETYGLFALPPADPGGGRPLTVTGELWAMHNDRPEVRAVMAYVGRGEHLRGWILSDPSVLAPHLDAALDWYPDAQQRRTAAVLLQTGIVRLPAIEQMAGKSLELPALWAQLTAWIVGDIELDAALSAIEATRP